VFANLSLQSQVEFAVCVFHAQATDSRPLTQAAAAATTVRRSTRLISDKSAKYTEITV